MVLVSGLPGRFIQGMPVEQKIRGKMVDQGDTPEARSDSQSWLEQAP